MKQNKSIVVKGVKIGRFIVNEADYISLTDMLKAKDGDFFISDWLRNRNTVEFLGIWERINNPNFNYNYGAYKPPVLPGGKVEVAPSGFSSISSPAPAPSPAAVSGAAPVPPAPQAGALSTELAQPTKLILILLLRN